jgi:hypothetical protein
MCFDVHMKQTQQKIRRHFGKATTLKKKNLYLVERMHIKNQTTVGTFWKHHIFFLKYLFPERKQIVENIKEWKKNRLERNNKSNHKLMDCTHNLESEFVCNLRKFHGKGFVHLIWMRLHNHRRHHRRYSNSRLVRTLNAFVQLMN